VQNVVTKPEKVHTRSGATIQNNTVSYNILANIAFTKSNNRINRLFSAAESYKCYIISPIKAVFNYRVGEAADKHS